MALSREDTEDALRGVSTATTLLREIWRRMEDGEDRLSDASFRAYQMRDAGDLDGACKQMEEVLEVEVVPLYREHAERVLANMTRLKKVAESGQADPSLPERSQISILLRRIEQGKPLELTNELRAFLQRAAASVAISEAEAEEALVSPERAGVLLGLIMERFREGSKRLERALERMVRLRDAGNLEEARQQMRNLLAVEVVPLYRLMAEENLASLDEPPAV